MSAAHAIVDPSLGRAQSLLGDWVAGFEPPPDLTVSQWAEAHRYLPEASAARGGRWQNATAPYLVGIMDAATDPTVRKLAIMKGAQTGGSEAINNVIGYHIHHDPCAMLLLQPTIDVAEAYSKERLADMIRSTPALAAVVRDGPAGKGSGQADSTLRLKMYPGGFLGLAGANSPNSFARWSARKVFADDIDRFPPVVGEDGDPVELLVNRTRSFYDALAVFVSTPTLKGGRIDTLYKHSDRRRYLLTCPRCGREDWVTWNDPVHYRIGYDGEDAATARLECPDTEHGGCGAWMREPERRAMVAGGRWRATRTPEDGPAEPGLVGFHLPAMVSTLGSVTLPGLVADWLAARRKGREALRVFINTVLAEGWEERGVRTEGHALLARRESYGEDVDVPAPAVCLTAGVDVQIDRFELQVQAWGPAMERWVVDARSIPGDPKRSETQAALLEALAVRYRHATGHLLPILGTCLDTGYLTDAIYDLVLAHQHRRLFATKGYAGRTGEPLVGKPNERVYGRSARPVRLYPVNVDDCKTNVQGGLTMAAPGPGYVHFPERVDEEYFAQLCGEHRESRYNKAGITTHMVWVQDRERNEALDTAVLCLAAFRILNPNIRHMAEVLATTPPPEGQKGGGGGGQKPPAPPARPQAPRVTRSGYLGR